MLSAGFDAAKGDVGNCKQGRRGSSGGLDLTSEDYLWTTEKVCSWKKCRGERREKADRRQAVSCT